MIESFPKDIWVQILLILNLVDLVEIIISTKVILLLSSDWARVNILPEQCDQLLKQLKLSNFTTKNDHVE